MNSEKQLNLYPKNVTSNGRRKNQKKIKIVSIIQEIPDMKIDFYWVGKNLA